MGKYAAIFRLSFIHSLKNYKTLMGLSLFLLTCLVIFAHLWKIAATRMGVVHLQSDKLLWYIAFNEWVLISFPDIQEEIEQDLHSGKLAYLLPRPISYLSSCFFEALGTLCANLSLLGIVSFTFTWLKVGSLPFSLAVFPCTLAMGLLAGCVAILFQMMIGISAFWLQEVSPFFWIWEKLLFALGGLILPLSVYPLWIQKIAHWTPFPAILGDRSALVLHFSAGEALYVVMRLLLWALIGLCALTLLYRRGLRILNIAGG